MIHQRMLHSKYGIYTELNGRKRIITRNPDGVEAISYDTSQDFKQPLPIVGNRVIYWPKEKVNAVITDGWKAVQTTVEQDYLTFHGMAERQPENACVLPSMNPITEKFVGYENLKGLRVSHILRMHIYHKDPEIVDLKTDEWYWVEAGCMQVQKINTHYDFNKNWIESLIDGWILEKVENGIYDQAAFAIPSDYREGSMQDFRRQAEVNKYGSPRETATVPDNYSSIRAKRPGQ